MKKIKKINFAVFLLIILNLVLLDILAFQGQAGEGLRSLVSKRIEDSKREQIFEEINPSKGFELNAKYGDLGPRMLSLGVIDLDKFKNSGQLSDENLNILTKGSDQTIRFTRENSHFLLNFFWALGFSNNTAILTNGEMQKFGDPGNYASTGGWTLSKDKSMNYYAKFPLINLTADKESLVQRVAANIYRPCCDNSTAFPDCNHGMALLGVLELMVANGASEDQMYSAAKYINAYWFPSNYYDIANYLKSTTNKSFIETDARIILGKNFSSASGYSQIKKWLSEKETKNPAPRQAGSSCGV